MSNPTNVDPNAVQLQSQAFAVSTGNTGLLEIRCQVIAKNTASTAIVTNLYVCIDGTLINALPIPWIANSNLQQEFTSYARGVAVGQHTATLYIGASASGLSASGLIACRVTKA